MAIRWCTSTMLRQRKNLIGLSTLSAITIAAITPMCTAVPISSVTKPPVPLKVPDRRWRRVVEALDWTGRFQVEIGPGWVLRDRPRSDGSPVVRAGRAAMWFAATRFPLTFWLAAPALLVGWAGAEPEPELVAASAGERPG